MTWMWVAGGILAGLYIYSKHKTNRKDAEETLGRKGQAAYSEIHEMREIREAITAGEHALDSLRAVMDRLDSARAWGICDLLGTGSISSRNKYGKIRDANEWVQLANNDLHTFEKELRDVTGKDEHFRTGDTVSILDRVSDQVLSDLPMQRRIHEAMAQTDRIMVRVQETIESLEKKIAGH